MADFSSAFQQTIAGNTNGKGSIGHPILSDGDHPQILRPLSAVRMSDVVASEIQWLWEPFLARSTFNLFEGPEGVGKTFAACALGCSVGNGFGLPGIASDSHIEPSNVLLISAEDSLSFVLKPRLAAMNAPMDRIYAIDEPFTLDQVGMLRLAMVLDIHKPKLAIIDPLFSYTGRINLNNDNEIRSITDAMKRLAETYECTILGIRHIGKSKGFGDVRNAGLNGVGWRAAARSVLMIGQNPENEKDRAICQTKNNLGPKADFSIGYKILDGQFYWTGHSSLTAEMMLSSVRNETTEERGERHDAMGFLRETLSRGQMPTKEVQSLARSAGLSEATLRRAKTAIGVKSVKDTSLNGVWYWQLPGKDDHEDVHIHSIEHLHFTKNGNSIKTGFLVEGAQDAHLLAPEHLGDHIRSGIRSRCGCGAMGAVGRRCTNCGVTVADFAEAAAYQA